MNKDIIKIMRPKQWLKNGFVFVPAFFAGSITDVHDILASVITFLAFSLAASSVYCLNDIIDVEADRRHPVKCFRPIASGAVTVSGAGRLMGILLVVSVSLLMLLGTGRWAVGGVILFYVLLNVAYCIWLKQFAIVDVCIIATGFVLRLLAGGFATDVVLSKWIVLMTFLLTLFLSFAKRRDDVIRMNETGEPPRKNTVRYNLTFINQAVTITATVTLVCYIMYTVSPDVGERVHTPYLYLTTVFVILGLLRYLQITVVDEKSGEPTKVMLRDRFMQAVVLLWALSFFVIIYIL